jgi:tRNA pseudouridine55 synthase
MSAQIRSPKNNPPKKPYHGWLLLNKPLGMSSNDAVMRVKRLLRPTKIGHAGTLDPLASGMLPLALGEGTKCIPLLMDAAKIYHFTVTFGEARSTGDAEGEVIATSAHLPKESDIRAALPQFTGAIRQTPPIYSAIKIDGKRAYALAREGKEVAMPEREVTIHTLTLKAFEGHEAQFEAKVSKGTYIRALGRDIAEALGSKGYISRLHRARVGKFTESMMISLDFLEENVHTASHTTHEAVWLTPLTDALDGIPAVEVGREIWQNVRQGRAVPLTETMPPNAQIALTHLGTLVAFGQWDGAYFQPRRFLHTLPI